MKTALYLALPWVAAEVSLRFGSKPEWFERADLAMATESVRYLFLGSSRTAAVDPTIFEDEVYKLVGRTGKALNLAMGYSTLAEYHLGLEWLRARHPESFRGLTVFFGVQGGFSAPDRWQDPWFNADKLANLAPWLSGDSLRRLLARGDLSLADRAYFAFGSFSKAVRNAPAIRGLALDRARSGLLALSGKKRPAADSVDLPVAAGIRPDETGLAIARAQAQNYAESLRKVAPVIEWRGIVYETAKMLESAGAKAVFFSEPLPPLMEEALRGPIANENRNRFSEEARNWNSIVLQPRIDSVDADYPDGWHLRASLSPVYTKALARTYADSFVAKPR